MAGSYQHRNSAASVDENDDESSYYNYYAEPASDQLYSGPVYESIPSSYSTLHHRHYSSRSRSNSIASNVEHYQPRHQSVDSMAVEFPNVPATSNAERTNSMTTRSSIDSHSGGGYFHQHNTPSFSNRPRSESRSSFSFQFFTQDEVEQAEGASTVPHDVDPVEYEVYWRENAHPDEINTNDDDYDSQLSPSHLEPPIYPNPHQHPKRYSFEASHRPSIDYYSSRIPPDVDESDSNYHFTEEIPDSNNFQRQSHWRRRSSAFDDVSSEEPLLGYDGMGKSHEYDPFSHYTFVYPSSRKQQRFYISEEDLVIFFAGYKSSNLRWALYTLLCICTFGMAYLVLRWFPRLRVACLGTPCPLGKCDWVVIENQWGELTIEDIQSIKYNRSISTIFKSENDEKSNDTLGEQQQEDEPFSTHDFPSSTSSSLSGLQQSSFKQRKKDSIRDTNAIEEDEGMFMDPDPAVPALRWVEYRYMKFIYHPGEDIFKTNLDWVDYNWSDPDAVFEGLDSDVHHERELVFGENIIDINEKTWFQLLVDEVLHPFYIFQVFSVILWAFDQYYYYASCIFFISVVSVANTLIETKSTLRRLREMSRMEIEVRVYRNSFWKTVPSTELVPGDIYEVSDPALTSFPCDSLLLSGDCIVNESMLTGESVPVSKLPATQEGLQCLTQSGTLEQGSNVAPQLARHYLYSGTKIIRVRRPTGDDANGDGDNNGAPDSLDVSLAMVVSTGFATTKGSLVRSMLFPKPSGFKFYQDSFKYIGVMAIIAIMGFIVCTYNFIKMHLPTHLIVLRALDLITIVVPPALPATLTIGTNISLSRLRSKEIFCISPNRVNVGGKVDVVCFDKTGTLTEDGLDVLGIRVIEDEHCQLSGLYEDLQHHEEEQSDDVITRTLATCHSLKKLSDGELIGDPLDVKMFEFTNWEFEEKNKGRAQKLVQISTSPDGGKVVETIKQFEFISNLRRMSVLTRDSDNSNDVNVYVKGAPEVMIDICVGNSIPNDYTDQLEYYTHRGYRVIACATKTYKGYTEEEDVERLDRTEVESELKFIGFIIFENKLKQDTATTIKQLNDAKIRTVMCTGDNVLTAISVGRECHMIKRAGPVFIPHFDSNKDTLEWDCIDDPDLEFDSRLMQPIYRYRSAVPDDDDDYNEEQDNYYVLAITGDAFRYLLQYGSDHQVEQMLIRGDIFARMSPDEKHELVDKLQEIDYTAGFCGDGANDCGALKAADVGISLSEAEASVAAPFTSSIFEISCVLDVIKEGRCALATSFSCFKYMSMYSAIQFVSVSILYSLGSNLGDFQFLWIDLFLILPIAIFMAWAKPYEKMSKKRPTANLVSRKVLIPLIGQISLYATFQFIIWKMVQQEKWYSPPLRGGEDDQVQSSDNSALFIGSSLQYIFIAVVLTVGPPYRQPMYKNIPFLITITVALFCTLMVAVVDQDSWFGKLMTMSNLSGIYHVKLLLFMALNFGLSVICEKEIFPIAASLFMGIKRLIGIGKTQSRKRYKLLREYKEHV